MYFGCSKQTAAAKGADGREEKVLSQICSAKKDFFENIHVHIWVESGVLLDRKLIFFSGFYMEGIRCSTIFIIEL